MKFKGVYQHNIKDCGVACLLSIIKYYKGNNTFENIRYLTKCDNNGVTALNLINASIKLGFKGRGLKCNIPDLYNLKLPLICHIVLPNGYNHYIVLYKIIRNNLYIFDPYKGYKKYTKEFFLKVWSNIVIEIVPIRKLDVIESNNSLISKLIKNNIFLFLNIFLISIFSIFLALSCNYYFKALLDYKKILSIFIIFSLIIIIKEICNYIRNLLIISLENKVDKDLSLNIHNKILSLPYYFFNSRTSGDIIAKFYDLDYIKELVIRVPISILIDSLLIIFSSIILININKYLFIIFLLICLLYFLIIISFNKILKNKIIINQENNELKNMTMIENIKSINTIKNMNLEKNKCKKFESIFNKYIFSKNKYEKVIIKEDIIKNIIILLGINIVLYYGIMLVNNNIINISDLILFNSLMIYFIDPLKELSELNPIIKNGINAVNRIKEIDLLKVNTYKQLELNNYDITIKDLVFSYNGYDNILDKKNITIKENDKVIVIGPSGSGKSTLFKLLNKTYEVDDNMIYINNIDINKMDTSNYIIYVSQEETLFNDTLYNNLVFDNKMDNLDEIIKLTNLDKVMKKRKLSFESIIEEDGLNLSRGERQKIILTRVLLQDKKIIILDEALNGVEEKEEIDILKRIIKKYKDKTIIYITHTQECKKIFDKIINFKEE